MNWTLGNRLMPYWMRQARVRRLLIRLEAWEVVGRDLLAQVIELSDPGDDIHLEALRVLELLER